MKNISSYPEYAARVKKRLHEELLAKQADFPQWLLAHMRQGFTAQEATAALKEAGLSCTAAGGLTWPVKRIQEPLEFSKDIESISGIMKKLQMAEQELLRSKKKLQNIEINFTNE